MCKVESVEGGVCFNPVRNSGTLIRRVHLYDPDRERRLWPVDESLTMPWLNGSSAAKTVSQWLVRVLAGSPIGTKLGTTG